MKLALLFGVPLGAVAVAFPVFADEAVKANTASDAGIQEIIVAAEKREQTLQDSRAAARPAPRSAPNHTQSAQQRSRSEGIR